MAGRVNDATGAVVPGATITARHLQRSIERIAISDADGRFVLAALPVGTYDVRAELSGFKPVVRQGVALTVGQALAVDFTLEVGGVVEAVNVIDPFHLVGSCAKSYRGTLNAWVGSETERQRPLRRIRRRCTGDAFPCAQTAAIGEHLVTDNQSVCTLAWQATGTARTDLST